MELKKPPRFGDSLTAEQLTLGKGLWGMHIPLRKRTQVAAPARRPQNGCEYPLTWERE